MTERLDLEQLDGVDPSQLRWTARWMSAAGGVERQGYGVTIPHFPDGVDIGTVHQDKALRADMLGLLNGCYVAAAFPIDAPDLTLIDQEEDSYLYHNERCLPRAFLTYHVETATSWEEAQNRIEDGFDPSQGALIEGGPALDGPPGWQAAGAIIHSPNRVVIRAEAEQRALLVLSEIWYPGWEARVDGERQTAYRVDGIVRGVVLQPGEHEVEWRYRPASLRWGAVLTLIALAAWMASSRWMR